jgi:multidrug efflux system membrane fusion protein
MNERSEGRSGPQSLRRGLLARYAQLGKAIPWVLAIALAGAGGTAYWSWKSRTPDARGSAATQTAGPSGGGPGGRRGGGAKGAQPVSVQAVRRQDIHVIANAIGSIAAFNTATVHAQVSGVLQRLDFKEGQQVKAGEVLALIDPRAFEASLGQAEGALARDIAQLDNARVDLKRFRDLIARDAVAKQQLDTQEALVRQLEGTVKLDQAAVDSARLQLSYTRVSAPIAGRVGLKQVDLGNVVQPTDANGIVGITQTRPIALTFSVPSAHLPQINARLRANEALPVEAWDRTATTRLAAGLVATVDNAIDTSTDTIKVKAIFANADDALYPNQAVSVRLQLDTLANVLTVPQAAVLRGAQGFYVYLVNADNSVSARVVKPGAVDGDWMAVEGPLQPGEQVVIDGVDRLRDGAKVEVIKAAMTASP